MSRKLPKSISPPKKTNFQSSSRHNWNRNSMRNSPNDNFLFEREEISYEPGSSALSRNNQTPQTKTHRIAAEIPYDHRHHSQPHFHQNRHTRVHYADNPAYNDRHTQAHEHHLPKFDQEFGIFGTTIQRSLEDHEPQDFNQHTGRGIQDLFDRPDNQKLSFPPRLSPPQLCTTGNCESVKNKPRTSPLSQCGQTLGGNPILAKYICKGHEDNAYSDNYKERDPDISALRARTAEACINDNCLLVTKVKGAKVGNKEKGTHPLTHQTNLLDDCKRSPNHEFPFKETPIGYLLINPDQIAYENAKLSVLVANPKKTKLNINISKDSHGSIEFINESVTKRNRRGSPTVEQDPEGVRDFLSKIKGKTEVTDDQDADNTENFRQHREGSLTLDREYSSTSRGDDKFIDNLHTRIKKAIHPDTYIQIGKKLFPCHAVALQVSSDFFDNIKRPRQAMQKIELPENMVPADIFPTVMEWMLNTQEARKPLVTKESVITLYIAAVYLAIKELQDQCLEYIRRHVRLGDPQLIRMWDEVKTKVGCQDMMNELATKAASLFPELYNSRKFLKIGLDELIMLLSSDEVVINSELDIFDAGIRWLLYDWFNRKIYTPNVMRTVRFGLMTPLNLTQINHCPNTIDAQNAKEYNQILAHQEVKRLIDAGLAYSILHESYQSNPDELNKWVTSTNAVKPRPRLGVKSKNKDTELNVLQTGPVAVNKDENTQPEFNHKISKPNKDVEEHSRHKHPQKQQQNYKPKKELQQEQTEYPTNEGMKPPPTRVIETPREDNIQNKEVPKSEYPKNPEMKPTPTIVTESPAEDNIQNNEVPKSEYPKDPEMEPPPSIVVEPSIEDNIQNDETQNPNENPNELTDDKKPEEVINSPEPNNGTESPPLFTRPNKSLSVPENAMAESGGDSDNSSPLETLLPPPNPDASNKISGTPSHSSNKWNVTKSKLVLPKFHSKSKTGEDDTPKSIPPKE